MSESSSALASQLYSVVEIRNLIFVALIRVDAGIAVYSLSMVRGKLIPIVAAK